MRGEKTIKVADAGRRRDGAVHDAARRRQRRAARRPRGDVLVVFEVEDDPRFERDGEDLYCEVLVTYPQLVFGADIDVPGVTASCRCACRPERRAGRCSTCADAACRA